MRGKSLTKEFLNKKTIPAFNLVEIMVAVLLMGFVVSIIIAVIYQAYGIIESSKEKEKAIELAQEQINGLINIKKDNWSIITTNTESAAGVSPKLLTLQTSNVYLVNDCTSTPSACVAVGINGTNYTTVLTIDNAYRDASNNLVLTPGTLDNHYRYVKVQINWSNYNRTAQTYVSDAYLADWDTSKVTQTTFADFRKGTDFNNTNLSGGSSAFVGISIYSATATTYTSTGTYTSTTFDLQNTTANIYSLDITANTSATGTSISQIEARATSQKSGGSYIDTTLSSWTSWATITCSTTNPSTAITTITCAIPNTSQFTSKQYFEYRLTLTTSNTANTPLVKTVSINYQ